MEKSKSAFALAQTLFCGTHSCVNTLLLFAACVNLEVLGSAYVKEASSLFLLFFFLLDGLKEKIATFRGTGAKKLQPIAPFSNLCSM